MGGVKRLAEHEQRRSVEAAHADLDKRMKKVELLGVTRGRGESRLTVPSPARSWPPKRTTNAGLT